MLDLTSTFLFELNLTICFELTTRNLICVAIRKNLNVHH